MLRRLTLLAVCGLAPIFAAHAQSPAEPPVSAELHVGTGNLNDPRIIWIPTRWSPAVKQVRLMRRLAGTQSWQAVESARDLPRREHANLIHATPADFARLRQNLLSDFSYGSGRGYAIADDISRLPKGEYEYGLFVRVGDGDFLETPVATGTWTPRSPRKLDAGLKPLGLFRDAKGLQAQIAVDARQMMSWAVGVRVMERRGGFASDANSAVLVPATREGWTAICHRPKEPLPSEVIFRVEDAFGDFVEESVRIDTSAPLGKPAVDAKACMPVQPPYKAPMPSPRLSNDLELFVGSVIGEVRILWIPKKWPLGMDGVQIMRRRGAEPWTAVGDVRRPSEEVRSRLDAAPTPHELLRIRRELRSDWRESSRQSFGIEDKQAEEIPEGVIEYGAFPVVGGARAAQPVATVPWLLGSEAEPDFGITGPRLLSDGKNVVAAFSVDQAKLDATAGTLRVLQISSYGSETLYTEVMDGGGPRKWKYICVPIEVGRTRAVRFYAKNLFGLGAEVRWPIDEAPSTTSDPAAIAQCYVPPPAVAAARPAPAITDVDPNRYRPPPPSPAPPPRQTFTSARITSSVDANKYYPAESRRRGEQGAPIVRVCVGPSGALLREPVITDNSGYPDLDAAAIEVAKAMRYAAGVQDGVKAPESCIKFKVKFFQTQN